MCSNVLSSLHLTLQGARVLVLLRISRHYSFGSHSLSYVWHLCLSSHWHLVCLVGSFRYNGLATLALAGPSGPRAGPQGPLRALRARGGPSGPLRALLASCGLLGLQSTKIQIAKTIGFWN